MIVVDNSEDSRNGDYTPTRFDAQADAVNLIYSAKTQANPESAVGLMSMGGAGPEMLTTFTVDLGKILDGLHRTKIRGSSHFNTGINIAALALKHRQNKSQRQRIVVFSCSPISDDEKSMVRLAKKMKKNNISVDIIAFGDPDAETAQKLKAFHDAVNNNEGCFFEIIPPGPNLLSDILSSTSLLAAEGVSASAGTGGDAAEGGEGGDSRFEFGVNPELDPELALALRLSYEEHKGRMEKDAKAQEEAAKEKLEGIPEVDEKEALLSTEGNSGAAESSKKEEEGDKKKPDDKDKDAMDTA